MSKVVDREIRVNDRVTFVREDAEGRKVTLWGTVVAICNGVARINMPWGIAFEPLDDCRYDSMIGAHLAYEQSRERRIANLIAAAIANKGKVPYRVVRG